MKKKGSVFTNTYNLIAGSTVMRKSEQFWTWAIDKALGTVDPRLAVFSKMSQAWLKVMEENNLQPSDILRMTAKYSFMLVGMVMHALATKQSIVQEALQYKILDEKISKASGYDQFQKVLKEMMHAN